MRAFTPSRPRYPDRMYKNELGDPFIVTKIIIKEIYSSGLETQEEIDELIEEIMDQWQDAYLMIWETRQIKGQPENIAWTG